VTVKPLFSTVAAVVIAGTGALIAQRPEAPSFDAVSIKVNRSGAQGGSSRAQPGRYVGVNVTLLRLIRLAYRPIGEFDGGPDWIDRDHFDVEAATGTNPTQPQMQAMLRTMLADRFKLRARTETRALPVYELTVARADGRVGPGLVRVADACPPSAPPGAPAPEAGAAPPIRCGFTVLDGVLKGMGTLANIASELVVAGRRTVDRTGLAGVYSIDLRWSPDNVAGLPADAPPEIFTAAREQLGLRLQASTARAEVLVIESAERPDEN
jgi:uncharacterized protein (TIGR03435 family)